MRFYLPYGAFNLTILHLNASCIQGYFCMFLLNYLLSKISSDQFLAYSMLKRLTKNNDGGKVSICHPQKNDLSALEESFVQDLKVL